MKLLKDQGYKCALTGRELTPDNCEADHIVSIDDGGPHEPSNIQLVRTEVNRAKGAMSNEAFVALCREVATRGGSPD